MSAVKSAEANVLETQMAELGTNARAAAHVLAVTPAAQKRRAIEAAHRFMWDIAGDQPGFEDASRALFAKDFDGFAERISAWPEGVRQQLGRFIERVRRMSA